MPRPRIRLPLFVSLPLELVAVGLFAYIICIRDLNDRDVRLMRGVVFERDAQPITYWIGLSFEFLLAIGLIIVFRRLTRRFSATTQSP